jgi:hypothetical protein
MDPTPAEAAALAAAAKMKNRRTPAAPTTVPVHVVTVVHEPTVHEPDTTSFQPTEDPRRATALKAKQRYLMESFCDMLHQRIRAKISSASESPFDFAAIGTFCLPTPENRERDIHSCYWAGNRDIHKHGTPIVQLLEGVRDHKTGKVHPEWLWGGQTAVANMKALFRKEGWLIEYDVDKWGNGGPSCWKLTVYLVKPERINQFWSFIFDKIPCVFLGVSNAEIVSGHC